MAPSPESSTQNTYTPPAYPYNQNNPALISKHNQNTTPQSYTPYNPNITPQQYPNNSNSVINHESTLINNNPNICERNMLLVSAILMFTFLIVDIIVLSSYNNIFLL